VPRKKKKGKLNLTNSPAAALSIFGSPSLGIMGDMANEIKLLTGNSHPSLAKAVADR
jgi:hypothetical protein